MDNYNSFIEVIGKKLYYEIINPSFMNSEVPFLVFLHEGLGSCEQWKDFPKSVSDKLKYPALIYDRYGYGKSEKLKEPRNLNFLHDEAFIVLPELLQKLNIKNKLILVGHSDGGSIALLFASKFPKKVIGLISEADHVKLEEISLNGIKNCVIEYEKGVLKEFLLKYHKEKTDSMFYGWTDNWLSEKGEFWNIEEYLKSITSPLLAIQGNKDNFGSSEQLISKLKNVKGTIEILYLNNCGHIPHFHAKEKVLKRIVDFITNLN